ncbi:MAG: hypothetical protein QNK03_02180 [Myxococcota bacterium]|nr:hypothetical protein [Myxococcota bacterium]
MFESDTDPGTIHVPIDDPLQDPIHGDPIHGDPIHEMADRVADALTAEDRSVLELELRVRDPEVIEELVGHESPREREAFALAALRIGVLSLRTARGQVDAQTVRGEVERMLGDLRKGLDEHRGTLQLEVERTLREYFDPKSGRFPERVEALTREDGELAQVIRRHVEGSDSALVRTLAQHVGSESPLLRLLDPDHTGGVVSKLNRVVEESLTGQRERILSEFSLDNREGALARLVGELTQSHGKLTEDLQGRIDEVVREFSLDEDDSALSRLVHRVERAQQQITEEFTLDSETSALARMRRELMGHVERQTEVIAGLEKRVAAELAALSARRSADARSTEHGNAFERALLDWFERAAQELGDVFADTSNSTGLIKNRKVGDAVIELGPEHQAAGARIVIEAKEDAGYSLPKVRDELELACKNRGAELGIFVLSARSAPEGWRRFQKLGTGLLVIWDADDTTHDVFLEAAFAAARTLCARARLEGESEVDFTAFERAIREVEKQAGGLDEIETAARTIANGTERIQARVKRMRANLERAVETLDGCFAAARDEAGGGAGD